MTTDVTYRPALDAIEALASELAELIEAGDLEAAAYLYVNVLVRVKQAASDLAREGETALAEFGPWSGGVWQPEGLPILEVRQGAERKKVQWEELLPYLRRHVLDPEGVGQFPGDEVVEAVDEAFDVLFRVAPLTGSTKPRVTEIEPILETFERTLDEFCETSPGRVSVQIHGEAS